MITVLNNLNTPEKISVKSDVYSEVLHCVELLVNNEDDFYINGDCLLRLLINLFWETNFSEKKDYLDNRPNFSNLNLEMIQNYAERKKPIFFAISVFRYLIVERQIPFHIEKNLEYLNFTKAYKNFLA